MDNEHRRRHLLLQRSGGSGDYLFTWCSGKREETPAALRALCGRVQLVSEYAADRNQCRQAEHRPPFDRLRICQLAEGSLVKVRLQLGGVRSRIGEPDMAVRANEISRVSAKTGAAHRVLPRKDVERQPPLPAHLHDVRRGVAVHVQLPVEGRKRREVIVRAVEGHPRQFWVAQDVRIRLGSQNFGGLLPKIQGTPEYVSPS
jgi:hypothetical protein